MMLHNLSEPRFPHLFETRPTAVKQALQWRDGQRARRAGREEFILLEFVREGVPKQSRDRMASVREA